MSKAKIIIEYKGKRYRVSKYSCCEFRRSCDLFKGGVCDSDGYAPNLPCDDIIDAFIAIGGGCPKFTFKEIRS